LLALYSVVDSHGIRMLGILVSDIVQLEITLLGFWLIYLYILLGIVG